MTVMTYNIHSGRDLHNRLDLQGIADVIAGASPAIVALNEVRRCTSDIGGEDQLLALAKRLDMHSAFAGAIPLLGGEYGVGLLSRYPIEAAATVRIPDIPEAERDDWFEPRVVLDARINVDGAPLRVLVTHVGLSAGEQRAAIETLCALLQGEKGPILLMGDFNVTPDDPVLAPLRAFVTDAHQAEPMHTFPADKREVKIDYIFTTADRTPSRVWTIATEASDHLPLLAELP